MAKKKKKEGIEIKIEDISRFQSIITMLSSFIDEVNINIDKDKMIIEGMDPSRIGLIRVVMDNNCFESFYSSELYHIPIFLIDFEKIIKRTSADDTLLFVYDTDVPNLIKIVMENEKKRKRTFRLNLINLDYEDFSGDKIMKREYDNKIIFNPEFFKEAINDAEIYSEILKIVVKKNKKIEFSSTGVIGDMIYELPSEVIKNAELKNTSVSSYSVVFLKLITKIFPITEIFTVYVMNDHPIRMEILCSNGAVIYYALAPRIEGDDDEIDEKIEEMNKTFSDSKNDDLIDDDEEDISEEVEEEVEEEDDLGFLNE